MKLELQDFEPNELNRHLRVKNMNSNDLMRIIPYRAVGEY